MRWARAVTAGLLLCAALGARTAPSLTPLQARWTAGVYHLGDRVPMQVLVPVQSDAFYLDGDLVEGADWGDARIARLVQRPPSSFPGSLTLEAEVQVFATGVVALPPLRLSVHTADKVQAYSIAAAPLSITPLLPPGNSPKPAPAAPLALPAPFPWAWLLLGLGVAAAALLGLARWLRRRRERPSAPLAPPGLRETDPDRWVREECERLFRGAVPAPLRYGSLTVLLRDYLEIKSGLPFLEWTTSEVHAGCQRLPALSGAPTTDLMGVLSLCDWVLFARYIPTAEEEDEARQRAGRLIAALAQPSPAEKAS